MCAFPCGDEALECPRCGIVFAKLQHRVDRVGVESHTAAPPPAPVPADPAGAMVRLGRGVLLAGLAVWTWQFARVPMGPSVMDSVLHLPNLVFHEAGHVLFSPFGRFMTVLGGSLFQVMVPAGLAVAFLQQRDQFGAMVCTWWAGQNLLDVAPYIADARALQLVLLGGKTGAEVEGHDWEYLLTTLGWMQHDKSLGMASHWAGLITMTGALVWGAVTLSRRVPAPDEALEIG
jgi:hypothetical protein